MTKEFSEWFLHSNNNESKFQELMTKSIQLINEEAKALQKPYSGWTREQLEKGINEIIQIPKEATDANTVFEEVQERIVRNSLWVSHPAAMAHLHCPPLIPSMAAEVMINALNQSMDSWDQSPAATYVEKRMIELFSDLIGYTDTGEGVFTSGGTQSNYMGMLLARNKVCQTRFQVNVQTEGLPSEAKKLRILCSEAAHFTVQQSAAQLGLGMNTVVQVEMNDRHELCVKDAKKKICALKSEGLIPFMVVATAGTTDFGSIDSLKEIGELSEAEELWFHVDAAYGGALLLSHQYRSLIDSIDQADSITIDFHKLYYQTVSCGAFFVKDRENFKQIAYYADYLNPEEEEPDVINLVEKSVQTTKRFDALKLFMTLKLMGTDTFGRMVDSTIQLAQDTAQMIQDDPDFELLNHPQLNAIVFRYLPRSLECEADISRINQQIQQRLYQEGTLIAAKTKYKGRAYMKFTMLNPLNHLEAMKVHLNQIKEKGKEIEREGQ
ncbi:L-2,4-diaminobutyrate decarboxylase [Bacillus ectoiniformans]|uniref:pyridoxal phosphate-dependent decarboxylase family protein n=1 Tax=Bacillus ectoiniformans TaxID=1494429 RepID=UPI001959EB8D|nr:aspartate aminotransferase family protein [Bacillus ectoiniformans]MBM7649160.1 L-2,4-diaminobutyrate decarboxylase [Bacillus ectoiniformans]